MYRFAFAPRGARREATRQPYPHYPIPRIAGDNEHILVIGYTARGTGLLPSSRHESMVGERTAPQRHVLRKQIYTPYHLPSSYLDSLSLVLPSSTPPFASAHIHPTFYTNLWIPFHTTAASIVLFYLSSVDNSRASQTSFTTNPSRLLRL